MILVSPTYVALAIAFLVVAAAVGVLAIATIGEVVVANRRTRLARHESVRHYYGGFALNH